MFLFVHLLCHVCSFISTFSVHKKPKLKWSPILLSSLLFPPLISKTIENSSSSLKIKLRHQLSHNKLLRKAQKGIRIVKKDQMQLILECPLITWFVSKIFLLNCFYMKIERELSQKSKKLKRYSKCFSISTFLKLCQTAIKNPTVLLPISICVSLSYIQLSRCNLFPIYMVLLTWTAPSGAQAGLSYEWEMPKYIKLSTKLYECDGTDCLCFFLIFKWAWPFHCDAKHLAKLKKESHIYHVHRVFKTLEPSIPILLVLHLELEFNRNILTKHHVLCILPGISRFLLNPWNCRFVQVTALWGLCQFPLENYLQVQKFLKQHSECNSVSD